MGHCVTSPEFRARFPLPFVVRALTLFEVQSGKLDTSKQHWQFVEDFSYVSDKFGSITVPKGFITDFASIPRFALGIIDDDSPTILFASAPHDKLFSCPYTDAGRKLSFSQCNEVLTEAMRWCGASWLERSIVAAAVSTGGALTWRTLRKK